MNSKILGMAKQSVPAAETDDDEPVTPAGRLFAQPLMDQVINCAIAGESAINLESIKSEIQKSIMLKHPRFCSVMVTDAAGRQFWRRTEVDVDRHVIIIHEPISGEEEFVSDEDAVNDYVANLTVSSPLSKEKPLWELHVLVAHRAVVFRVHHALGDGISLMSMFLSCCRRLDDPEQAPAIAGVGAAAILPKRWSVWTVVKLVWFTLLYSLELILRLMWLSDKTTAVSGGSGVELWPRRLATARFRIEDMKTVKRAVAEATINDVLFGVIEMGISRYFDLRSNNSLQEGDQITGVAMVNLRPQAGLQDLSKLMNTNANSGSRWGNKFGIILLPVCYHKHNSGSGSGSGSDPLLFVRRAKAMIDRKKLSLEAPFSYMLMDVITHLFGAKLTSILNYQVVCNTTFTVSNVIGPREKITLCGNPVKYMRVTTSSLPHAITMHMLSYAGFADMQILVAKEIIPDPKLLAKCFEDALMEMKEEASTSFQGI
ncbi:wax ester synthase/diacylglycerol acyltransferase 11-like isoform X2 [Andrographis paniculata]|uniref:wax ester synthase/diacylglycerol acyltransferase 11-like isoform X2 n=1 Tax=Andrographis paniculata TaxID=175694 RepID=UPI0021E917D5|nr:wax ester synthase/diacylglycerol acyltransferase 11-like isoform X2 [Andrographis paniculata]